MRKKGAYETQQKCCYEIVIHLQLCCNNCFPCDYSVLCWTLGSWRLRWIDLSTRSVKKAGMYSYLTCAHKPVVEAAIKKFVRLSIYSFYLQYEIRLLTCTCIIFFQSSEIIFFFTLFPIIIISTTTFLQYVYTNLLSEM